MPSTSQQEKETPTIHPPLYTCIWLWSGFAAFLLPADHLTEQALPLPAAVIKADVYPKPALPPPVHNR